MASRDLDAPPPIGPQETVLLIDGDRRGRFAVFDHAGHRLRLGGDDSCGRCHHRNLPLDRGTPCATCHRDMYRCSDTFSHQRHVEKLGGNAACKRCHRNGGEAKTRAESTACIECHAADIVSALAWTPSLSDSSPAVQSAACGGCHSTPAAHLANRTPVDYGVAPGYRWAMHRLCVECHLATEAEKGLSEPKISRCSACHRGSLDTPDETDSLTMIARLDLP